MTESEIKSSIYDWFSSATGITVIFDDQAEGKRPAKPYGTIRIISQVNVGDQQRQIDADGIATIAGWRRMLISLNVIGPGAIDYMNDALMSLSKQTVLDDFFWSDGIAIVDKGPVQNLTTLLETVFEPRAQMDLTISYAQEDTDDVGYIESVEVNDDIIQID